MFVRLSCCDCFVGEVFCLNDVDIRPVSYPLYMLVLMIMASQITERHIRISSSVIRIMPSIEYAGRKIGCECR